MAKEIITYKSDKTNESKTLAEWSRDTGISASTLFCRLKRGMSIDESIEASTKGTPYDAITDPVSRETHSLREWSEILGIPYSSLHNRIHKFKWPIEKVLHADKFEPVMRKPRPKESYKHMDLAGKKFGKLTVLRKDDKEYEYNSKGKTRTAWRWLCQCECGNQVSVIENNLTHNHVRSCPSCCTADNKLKDMTGKKFGMLTVIKRAPDKIVCGVKVAHWYCKCDCGNSELVSVSGHNLRNGHTKSCGCRIGGVTHGKRNHELYKRYSDMYQRCHNENDSNYKRYGERGIYICEEWDGYGDGFENFFNWAITHGYSKDLTIDRIDNDGPYAPWNCRWTTAEGQANNRSSNVVITYKGESLTASQWAKKLNVEPATLLSRHKKGWSDEDIIEIPINYLINKVTSSSGETHTIREWADIAGIKRGTLYDRIYRYNWNIDAALVTGSTNPDIYNYVYPASVYAMQHSGYIAPPIPPAMYYVDILGRYYTPEEWDAHQAIFFD